MPKYYEEKTSQYVIVEVYGERCEAWLEVDPPQTDRTGGYIRTLIGKTTLAMDMPASVKEQNGIHAGGQMPFKVWVDGDWYKGTLVITETKRNIITDAYGIQTVLYAVEGINVGKLELME